MYAGLMPKVEPYQPVRICIGLTIAPIERSRNAMRLQLETFNNKRFRAISEIVNWRNFFKCDGEYHDVMGAEIALLPPREDLMVYVCNLADGWISVYENVIKANAFDAFFFRTTLSEAAEYKVFGMTAWRRGILTRQVRLLQEEKGWGFLNKGDPLPFEDAERYKERKIERRLDRKLIESYSESVGYGIGSVTSFNDQCTLFRRSNQ